ncbi:hypothetical protein Hoch_2071 [Haliangium ochraceum DSM 14365]|uniref:Uncharacterized protein n=1 Tax=Haliangium ochraceum (strain DSM 14365 / JCM 11303 / SMP-2) TaxID=502025 RepID=D0LG14_HALO1|nr:hypothetical protein Hoch_2071 [Haliangium ochraceum DSM 14365]
MDGAALERWRAGHAACAAGAQVLFASVQVYEDQLEPSVKLDYPDLRASAAALWRPRSEAAAIAADVQRLCALAGRRRLSFLGVRFHAEQAYPTLKYYCDAPAA